MKPHPIAGADTLTTRRDWLRWTCGTAAACAWAGTTARRACGQAQAGALPWGRILIRAIGARRAENNGLFSYDLSRRTPQRLLATPPDHARVSRDGRILWYVQATGSTGAQGLWASAPAPGDAGHRISERTGFVSPSPDGRRLIVSSPFSTRANAAFQTWLMNADGTGAARLAMPETAAVVDWSPDGQWLLVASRAGRPLGDLGALELRRADGSQPRSLVASAVLAPYARFSPDGAAVLFNQVDPATRVAGLYSTRLEGGEPAAVLAGSEKATVYHGCWSPDGKHVAALEVERKKSFDTTRPRQWIEVAPLAGGKPTALALPFAAPLPIGWIN